MSNNNDDTVDEIEQRLQELSPDEQRELLQVIHNERIKKYLEIRSDYLDQLRQHEVLSESPTDTIWTEYLQNNPDDPLFGSVGSSIKYQENQQGHVEAREGYVEQLREHGLLDLEQEFMSGQNSFDSPDIRGDFSDVDSLSFSTYNTSAWRSCPPCYRYQMVYGPHGRPIGMRCVRLCPPERCNPETRQCCPPDTIYNPSTGSCRPACPPDTVYNPETGSCEPNCPAGMVYNQAANRCVCAPICGPNQVRRCYCMPRIPSQNRPINSFGPMNNYDEYAFGEYGPPI